MDHNCTITRSHAEIGSTIKTTAESLRCDNLQVLFRLNIYVIPRLRRLLVDGTGLLCDTPSLTHLVQHLDSFARAVPKCGKQQVQRKPITLSMLVDLVYRHEGNDLCTQ